MEISSQSLVSRYPVCFINLFKKARFFIEKTLLKQGPGHLAVDVQHLRRPARRPLEKLDAGSDTHSQCEAEICFAEPCCRSQ